MRIRNTCRHASRAARALGWAAIAAMCIALVPGAGLAESHEGASIRISRARSDAEMVQTLQLEVGKSAFLQTDFNVRRVSVGNPAVLDVVVLSPRGLQLVPNQVGTTNVVVWESSGAPSVILDVEVGTSYAHIERQLRSIFETDDIHVESAGQGLVLRGSVSSPVHVERALAVARAFVPDENEDRVVNALEVGGNQQVMLEVIIAEMDRSLTRDIAVDFNALIDRAGRAYAFSSSLGGLAILDELTPSLGGTIDQAFTLSPNIKVAGTFIKKNDNIVNVFMDVAIENALARVLAKPTLMARSGQRATFLAGGEFPIPVVQSTFSDSVTVEYKEFGVGVEFAPTVLGDGRIHLEVSPEVSEPDFSAAFVSGSFVSPSFVTRRASTTVDLNDGQSFAIAGLLSDRMNESVRKYPFLGDLPVLGVLFRSASFERQETEVVLIVTPRLVKPLPPGPIPLPTDSFVAPNDFEFFLLGALEAQRSAAGPQTAHTDGGGLLGPFGHRVPIDTERSAQ